MTNTEWALQLWDGNLTNTCPLESALREVAEWDQHLEDRIAADGIEAALAMWRGCVGTAKFALEHHLSHPCHPKSQE